MALTPEQKARLDAYAKQKAAQTATLPAPVAPTAPVGLTPEQRARLDAFARQKQAQAVPQAPKEEGFLKSIAKGIAQPFVKAGVTGLSAFESGLRLLNRDVEGADKRITAGYNVPGFGQVKPLGIASTPTIVKNMRGDERLEGFGLGRETLQTLGTGAEIAPWLFGAGQTASLAKTGLKEPLKQILKRKAIEGGVEGVIGGAGSALQREDATAADVGRDALFGGAFGAGLNVAIPVLGKVGQKALTKTSPEAALAAKAKAAASKDADELLKLERRTPALQKYVDKAKTQDFDVRQAIAETNMLADAVDENGLINTVQEGGAIDRFNKWLEPRERVVSDALRREGRTVSLDVVEKQLRKAVDESGVKGAAKKRAYSSIEDEIAGLRLDADEAGMISIAEINNAKIDKYRNINYMDPGVARLDKSVAKKLKEIVEANTDSMDVKTYNAEMSKFYTMLGYLEKLNNKRAEGGRLGKYFAQTVGAVAGSSFGPFGAIAGSELGGLLKGQLMKNIFSDAAGRQGPQVTARMADAIKPRPRPNFPQLPAPRKPLPGALDQYVPSKSGVVPQEQAREALKGTLMDPARVAIPQRGYQSPFYGNKPILLPEKANSKIVLPPRAQSTMAGRVPPNFKDVKPKTAGEIRFETLQDVANETRGKSVSLPKADPSIRSMSQDMPPVFEAESPNLLNPRETFEYRPTQKESLQMKRDEIRILREQVEQYRFPDEQLEDGYRQFKALAQRSPDALNPDMDWEAFSRRYGKDKTRQIIEDSVSGGGPYGMTNSDAYEAFKTRYITERLVKSKADEMQKKLKRGDTPVVDISAEDAAVFAVAPMGGMEVTYDENGKPQFSYNAEKASQSMLMAGGLLAGKKTLSKRGTSLPSKASKNTSLPAKLANKKFGVSEQMVNMAKSSPNRGSAFVNDMSGQRFWHGSADNFDVFDINKAGKTHSVDWGRGISLAKDEKVARQYARSATQGTDSQGFTKDFYIDPGAKVYAYYKKSPRDISQKLGDDLAKDGYDALYIYDELGKVEEVLVMNPNVIYNELQLLDIWKRANKT